MRFRVSANVLKTASELFATTLSLPQPPETCSTEAIIENLDEDGQTIKGLLRMIMAKELPRLDTLEAIEPLLLAADKWAMPGPCSILKMLLVLNPSIASDHPLRLYWLGCHLGWDELTKLASKFSCLSQIFSSPWSQKLASTDLLRLMKLHWTRRNLTKAYLERLGSNCPWSKKTGPIHTKECHSFKWQLSQYVDIIPLGRPLEEKILQDIFKSSQLENAQCDCGSGGCFIIAQVINEMNVHWSTLPQTV